MRKVLLASLCLACAAAPLRAQGTTVTDNLAGGRTNAASVYSAEVQREVKNLLAFWQAYWIGDSAENLIRLYAPNAVVYPARGNPARGRRAVRQLLDTQLAATGPVDAEMKEFGVSGELSYMVLDTKYDIEVEGQLTTRTESTVMIMRRTQEGGWEIELQTSRERTP